VLVWFSANHRELRAPGARGGRAKQSLRKLFHYALNGLVSFSDLPLQWIGVLGLGLSLASFGYGAALFLVKLGQLFGLFANLEVKGFTTLAVAIFCLGGIQLMCLGIIGQYLARIYRELKSRPLFVIEQVLSSDEPNEYSNLANVETDHWFYVGKRDIVRHWIQRVHPLRPHHLLADCGAGTGTFAAEMASFCQVLALDDHENRSPSPVANLARLA